MALVRMYTSDPCPYCVRARRLLAARGAHVEEIEIPWSDVEARRALVERTRHRTVPQIFIGERFIGGYDELAALDRAGELVPLLTG